MKCKDCIYLDLSQKTIVGYVCTNTKRRRGTTRTLGHLKYKHTPACKTGFKAKENMIMTEIEKTCENCKYEFEDMEGVHCRHCINNATENFEPKDIVLTEQEIRAKAIDEMVEGIREILECNAIYNIDCIATLAEQMKGE